MKIITRTVQCYDYIFCKLKAPEEDGEAYEVEDTQTVTTYEPLTKKAIKELTGEVGSLAGYICTSTATREIKKACTLQKFMSIATPYENDINIVTEDDKEENNNG